MLISFRWHVSYRPFCDTRKGYVDQRVWFTRRHVAASASSHQSNDSYLVVSLNHKVYCYLDETGNLNLAHSL